MCIRDRPGTVPPPAPFAYVDHRISCVRCVLLLGRRLNRGLTRSYCGDRFTLHELPSICTCNLRTFILPLLPESTRYHIRKPAGDLLLPTSRKHGRLGRKGLLLALLWLHVLEPLLLPLLLLVERSCCLNRCCCCCCWSSHSWCCCCSCCSC